MKKQIGTLMMVLGLFALTAGAVFAEEAVNTGNKFCPITGEQIGEGEMKGQDATVEYNGKVYNLCCPMCKKTFLKDPEAAIKAMEEQEADMMEE